MAEAEGIPPSASIASTGLSIRYVRGLVYAYSGLQSISTVATDLLNFNSGSNTLSVTWQPTYFTVNTGEDLYFKTYMNEILIRNEEITSSSSNTPYDEIQLIIPPLTKFVITGQLASGERNIGVTLTGRVYGAD